MSSRSKRRLWWLVIATAIGIPNCVGHRRVNENPVDPPRTGRSGNRPETRPSAPPAAAGNDGLGQLPPPAPPARPAPAVAPTPEAEAAPPMIVDDPGTPADAAPVPGQNGISDGIPFVTVDRFDQGQLSLPIFDLRVEQLQSVTISGLLRDTTVLVPFGLFTDLVEVFIGEVQQGRSFRGRTGRGRMVDFVIDTDSGLVRVGTRQMAIDSTTAIWFNDDLYLGLGVLTELLDVRGSMDWTDLELRMWDASHLPAVARYERALRRRFFEGIGTAEGTQELPTASPPIDGAVLDWSVAGVSRDPVQSSIFQLGAGGLVAGGSLDIEFSRVNSANINTFDWSWVRAWSGRPWIRQLRFGEIGSTGRRRNAITGVSVTNAPFVRPVAFAEEILAGEFPEGWEVEVYRGGQLIAFTVVDSSGRFGINLPVQYGQNPVTLIGYGPRGEVVVRERTFEIPFLRLPARTFEYAASVGECQAVHCQLGQNVDFRYGINDRLTVQAGSDFFLRDTLANVWAPYGIASMAVTRSISLTGEAVLNGLARARADYAPTPDLRMSFSQTWFDRSDASPLIGSAFERRRTEIAGFFRPGLLDDRVFFEARGTRSTGATRTQDLASVSSTLRWSGARMSAGLFIDRVEDVSFTSERAGVETSFNTILRGPLPALRSAFVTAHVRFDHQSGLSRYGVSIGRQILRPLRIDIRAEWDELLGSTVNLELNSIFRQVRASSRSQYARGAVNGTQQVEGSLLWNRPGGRAEFTNGRAMGRAGATGSVYLDENMNGTQDPQEIGIPHAQIRIGSQIVTADSLGQFATWDLIPFERALVEIDPMSIDNPLWVPQYGPSYITPTPNSYQMLDLPVLQGGEVNGRVVFEDDRPVMGATVLLIQQETGDTTRVMTFSDGSFYAFGLRPGSYKADLAQSVRDRLGGVVSEMPFAIRPLEGILFADDVILVFVREDNQDGAGGY